MRNTCVYYVPPLHSTRSSRLGLTHAAPTSEDASENQTRDENMYGEYLYFQTLLVLGLGVLERAMSGSSVIVRYSMLCYNIVPAAGVPAPPQVHMTG